MDYMALYGSRTEALRKLTLVTGDLVVWTMLPAFLRALWWGTEDSRGPRGRDPRGGAWKGSTGKWASLCRSRAAGHAPRLPSSFLFAGGSRPAAGERRDGRKNTRRRVPAALQTRQPPHFFFLSLSLSLSRSRSLARGRCRGTRMNIYRSPRLRSIGRLSDKKTSSNSNRGLLPSLAR